MAGTVGCDVGSVTVARPCVLTVMCTAPGVRVEQSRLGRPARVQGWLGIVKSFRGTWAPLRSQGWC